MPRLDNGGADRAIQSVHRVWSVAGGRGTAPTDVITRQAAPHTLAGLIAIHVSSSVSLRRAFDIAPPVGVGAVVRPPATVSFPATSASASVTSTHPLAPSTEGAMRVRIAMDVFMLDCLHKALRENNGPAFNAVGRLRMAIFDAIGPCGGGGSVTVERQPAPPHTHVFSPSVPFAFDHVPANGMSDSPRATDMDDADSTYLEDVYVDMLEPEPVYPAAAEDTWSQFISPEKPHHQAHMGRRLRIKASAAAGQTHTRKSKPGAAAAAIAKGRKQQRQLERMHVARTGAVPMLMPPAEEEEEDESNADADAVDPDAITCAMCEKAITSARDITCCVRCKDIESASYCTRACRAAHAHAHRDACVPFA